jgi:hypothetical protein
MQLSRKHENGKRRRRVPGRIVKDERKKRSG